MQNITEQTMAAAALKQMNVWEQKYHDISELFLLNEELMATVPASADPEMQLALIEPLIETIGESADILADEYIGLCEGDSKRKATAKTRVEGTLRKIYVAMQQFSEQTKGTRNAAHAILVRIKRQLEHVVSHFMDFMTLSLDRIMQKNDVEELKQRHANIALMLHQLGQGA